MFVYYNNNNIYLLKSINMKFLRTTVRILTMIIVIIILLFLWKFLQKQEIIVTNTTKSIISQLQSVNKLESAEVTITKIMQAEKDMVDIIPSMSFDDILQNALFQDKMVFELEWRVVAGIDLKEIETGDIVTNVDGSTSVNLPEAKILHIIIDENSKPYDRKIWVLTKGNIEMETMIRNTAKEEMKQEAIDSWILEIAKQNAIENLEKTFDKINIRFK